MKNIVRRSLSSLLFLGLTVAGASAAMVPVTNPDFSNGEGQISALLNLNPLGTPPASTTQQIGTSGWNGAVNATTVGNLGFRPGIAINQPGNTGVAVIQYDVGVSLGGLLGALMPPVSLWQNLSGFSLNANSTYTFSVSVDSGTLLDVTALGARGFGLGVTTGSSATDPGTFFADSQNSPGLLTISLLGGTEQTLSFTFTTGDTVPQGDLGLVIFAGRGSAALDASLLSNFVVDNVSFSVVPEMSTGWMSAGALGILILFHHRRNLIAAWRRRSTNRRVKSSRMKRRQALLAFR
jgi:hypothetical protein